MDLIVIGAGPAGLTSALFAKRHGLDVTVFDNPSQLSNLAITHYIENWPGTKRTPGIKLLEDMKAHVKREGIEIKQEKVIKLSKSKGFVVKTPSNEYECKAVIIAMGLTHRKANIKGEDELLGKGVSYCTVCDGPLFKGKAVAVIGGGDSAVKGALALKDMGVNKVYLIHRRDKLRAEEMLQKRILDSDIKIMWNSLTDEIIGDKFVKAIKIKDKSTEKVTEIPVDGIFVEIGSVPVTEILKNIKVKLDEGGFIIVNQEKETNVKGVFAAGDITNSPLKQDIAASADGAIAAISAYRFLKG